MQAAEDRSPEWLRFECELEGALEVVRGLVEAGLEEGAGGMADTMHRLGFSREEVDSPDLLVLN